MSIQFRKVDCSSFVEQARVFLQQPLTVLTKQTRQEVCAINQSIFKYDVYDSMYNIYL
jgi:hypothetical protein